MRRSTAWGVLAFGAALSRANPASELAAYAASSPRPVTPHHAAPAAPPPKVSLSLEAHSTAGPFRIRVSNDDDVPVRVLADTRYLSLDVSARGERRPYRCELPTAMFPQDPLQRAIVLPPHRSFAEAFDPRLYCFGSKGMDALTPGAIVVAHLGRRGRTAGIGVVSPIDDVTPVVSALATLDTPPVALPDDPTPLPAAPTPRTDRTEDIPKLSLATPRSIDAISAQELSVPLTLKNEGSSPVIVRFRPDTLGFDVSRPGMTQRCAWPVLPTSPSRELYTTLASHASLELTVELADYCDRSVLDQSGLITVRAWLDTRSASGNALGLRTFDGVVVAPRPTLIRLQTGTAPEAVEGPELVEEPTTH